MPRHKQACRKRLAVKQSATHYIVTRKKKKKAASATSNQRVLHRVSQRFRTCPAMANQIRCYQKSRRRFLDVHKDVSASQNANKSTEHSANENEEEKAEHSANNNQNNNFVHPDSDIQIDFEREIEFYSSIEVNMIDDCLEQSTTHCIVTRKKKKDNQKAVCPLASHDENANKARHIEIIDGDANPPASHDDTKIGNNNDDGVAQTFDA